MSKQYNQSILEQKVLKCLIETPQHLYQKGFVGRSGVTKDTHLPYTEVISRVILDNMTLYRIPTLTRVRSYKILSHKKPKIPISNREEEKTAIRMRISGWEFNGFGHIIDYQVPLKNKQDNAGVGKIDLLSIKDKEVYILELKKQDNDQDGLLTCVLESYTYSRTVDFNKLKSDYDLDPICTLVPAPLVFSGSRQHKEYMSDDYPMLHKLMDELGIKVFVLDPAILKELPE